MSRSRFTALALLVASLVACTSTERSNEREMREARERAELSRLMCEQIDHCDLDLWDIDDDLDAARQQLGDTCAGLTRSVTDRAIFALQERRNSRLEELRRRDAAIRRAVRSCRCPPSSPIFCEECEEALDRELRAAR